MRLCDEATCLHESLVGLLPCEEKEKHEIWFKVKMLRDVECVTETKMWVSLKKCEATNVEAEDDIHPNDSVSNVATPLSGAMFLLPPQVEPVIPLNPMAREYKHATSTTKPLGTIIITTEQSTTSGCTAKTTYLQSLLFQGTSASSAQSNDGQVQHTIGHNPPGDIVDAHEH